ncbi:E3 ubiquitin-protein ligase PUB23 [Iris pallida]|uniref:U-box domain-containing protein n=1 Tax=Iris pallida TaxID=29817 RepID=A0AAX6EX22_IRIPA|nr:E3 ubiquitin-protein ligase PUB23 [Iris pallida]
MASLLADIESTPFKVGSLKKLQSVVETSAEVQNDFVRSGGIQVLSRTMSQIVHEGADFSAFRACEESVAVLHHLPVAEAASAELLSRPECMRPMMLLLQRGSAEARLHTMAVLQKLSRTSKDWMLSDQQVDVARPLLELLSDEVSARLSSCALDVLTEVVAASKKNRNKAIEAGAVCVLVELLPDASQHKCERILLLLSKLCDCPEGRAAFADHGLGVAVVSKKILRVSELGTKLGVKILSKVCNFVPTDKVIDDMVVFGAVRKLFCLLHVDGRSSTKDKAMGMIRVRGGVEAVSLLPLRAQGVREIST